MTPWANFFIAMAGAAATLTGLIFVGVSISLTKILAIATLPERASLSLILLLTVLIVAALCLVPDQSLVASGTEVLAVGGIVWILSLVLDIGMLRKTDGAYKKHAARNLVFTQLAVLPYIIAGVVMICNGYYGIYWLIPAMMFSFIKAVLDAWVLLVEIHR